MEIGVEPPVAEQGLEAFETVLTHLVKAVEDGALGDLDQERSLRFARRFERARCLMALVDHALVGDLEVRGTADALGQSSTAALLVWLLRISPVEAARRVRAAEQLGPRQAMTGEVLAPVRPALAAAQRTGGLSGEQANICLRAIGTVDHRGFDPADLDAADALLAGFAGAFGPVELRGLARQVVDRIDPDGSLPDEQVHTERRHLALHPTRDGAWTLEGRLTGPLGVTLSAVLGPLATPRVHTVTLDDGRSVADDDPRHHGQRLHDALEEVCDRLLRSGSLPDTGGTPATVIVTIPEADLTARRRWGVSSDGTVLSAQTITDLTGEAEVCPTVVDARGVPLRLGRTRRLATPGQTLALAARDGGCSFPGCTRPPEWCERHHVVAWVDGGPTDLDNLTLLCAYHHHGFAARGWTCRVSDGLPEWIPPRWVDAQQRPLHNTRIAARIKGLGLRC